jgi:chemotaxis response regulator CheB
MKYKTIFHVDDDEDDCQMVSDIIATIPDCASYFKSHNPTEALQILDKKEVTPDVILLDYYITTMNAPEFVAQLKSRTPLGYPNHHPIYQRCRCYDTAGKYTRC